MRLAAPLMDAETPQAFFARDGGADLIENLTGHGGMRTSHMILDFARRGNAKLKSA